ncbi:unnamed protein product [Leuciscus chuanchicus]
MVKRFAFWTDEARSLVQGTLQPVYRVPRQSAISEKVPAHIEAVENRTAEEKRLVDFIVKLQGSEEHLVVTSSRVPVYLDSKEQQDILFSYLRGVLDRTPTQLSFTDEVQFICRVLFPEVIIYALAVLRNVSLQEAEQVFLSAQENTDVGLRDVENHEMAEETVNQASSGEKSTLTINEKGKQSVKEKTVIEDDKAEDVQADYIRSSHFGVSHEERETPPIAQFCTAQPPNAPGVSTSNKNTESQQHQPSQTSSI